MSEAQPQDPNIDAMIAATLDAAPEGLPRLAMDFPMARVGELLAAIQGPALRAVLDARIEQIVKHGHDAEHDQMQPIGQLPKLARETAAMAMDTLGGDERRNIPVARRRLARAAAICMAAIDRLDMIKEEGSAGHVA